MNPRTGEPSPLVSQELWEIVMKNKELLDNAIDYSKDFEYDYFGFKTLERSYLLKMNGRIVERPQHMLVSLLLLILFNYLRSCLICDFIRPLDESGTWYSQKRSRVCIEIVSIHVRKVVHSCHSNSFQCW